MNIRNLVTPTVYFILVVVPSALGALFGGLLVGLTLFYEWKTWAFVFGLSVLLYSGCIINFWVKSFISNPGKKLSQPTQVVLIITSIFLLTFSIVQGIYENVLASFIGISYLLVIAAMSLNYFYHRAEL
jgi:hypothetical protein